MAEPLGIADTLEVLARLGDVADKIVLIGGQALNFWAEQYKSSPALHLLQDVLTSKDIDFYGTQEHARLCALALEGRTTRRPKRAVRVLASCATSTLSGTSARSIF